MKTHKDLNVWRESIDFVTELYRISSNFPESEKFGLTVQMRRAAVSIPSNIAEGAARNSQKEFIQFIGIALGSLVELDTQFIISEKLNFLKYSGTKTEEQLISIKRQLIGLKHSLEKH